jgi:hypothetical protein
MWLLTSLVLSAGFFIYCLYIGDGFAPLILPASFMVSGMGSIPAFIVVFLFLPVIKRLFKTY